MLLTIKKEETYVVENFIFHKIDSDSVIVQNKHGIVKITQKSMIHLIELLDKLYNVQLDESYFSNFFNEDTEDAIKFLLNYKIISKVKEMNFNVTKIKFYSNHKGLTESVQYLLKENSKQIEVVMQIDEVEFDESDLVMVFLNPYDKKLAQYIVDKIKNSNSILMMSYVYHNKFFVDSLYRKSWRNPCHFCHIGHIESQLRVDETGKLTYQHLIDLIYQEDSSFKVETPLGPIEIVNILSVILNQLDRFIIRESGMVLFSNESLQDINNCIMMDLITRQKSNDTGIFWELCDCYE
ncbi:McbB family protein [Heyndrickxia oleronia]|uniref:McbB family protein n=2 Tax=Heyndrickxia oleronia TaxID=38875 RepID=UPI00242BBED7|nr:McbB family protein [Heyndrickxia oleronia]MCI1615628.1 McbB family protein [Heyndrickxia oleronia]MCI1745999.1 McbB family protein [Heyndrickxia oleronia]MCI1763939.1 McbB family protein [Heyndrickxia oleronia]